MHTRWLAGAFLDGKFGIERFRTVQYLSDKKLKYICQDSQTFLHVVLPIMFMCDKYLANCNIITSYRFPKLFVDNNYLFI